MFLDDKIVKYVLDNKSNNESELDKIASGVFDLCFDELKIRLNNSKSDKESKVVFKKVFAIYKSAAKQLIKKDYPFLNVNGFENYFRRNEKYNELLTKVGVF